MDGVKATRLALVPPHPTRFAARLLRLRAAHRVPQGEKGIVRGAGFPSPPPLSSRPQRSEEPGQRRGWRECRRVGWRRRGCPGSPRCAAMAGMTSLEVVEGGRSRGEAEKGLCPRF